MMSWQGDIVRRYKAAKILGVNLDDVDVELRANDDWFDEDTAMTLIDCLLEHIQQTNQPQRGKGNERDECN